jgi:hypothetical protein
MFGHETPRPLDTVAGTYLRDGSERPPDSETVRAAYEEAATAIQDSWLRVRSSAELRHAANQRQRNRTQKAVDFQVGDYVLVYAATTRNKLRVKWLGPYRVTDTINPRVFEVQSLLDESKREVVHAQRMRMYADAALNVTEDLRNQAAYDDVTHVTGFSNFREMDDDTLQLRTQWLGFEPSEATWEDVRRLHEDVPVMVVRYLRTIEGESELVHPLLTEWDRDYVAPPTAAPRRRRGRRPQPGRRN